MLGIKKMMKDDDATGIVSALSACLPSSVVAGGIGSIITLLGTICAAVIGFIPAAWTACTLPCCFGCGSGLVAGLFTLIEGAVCIGGPVLIDAFMATCVGGITSLFAASGTVIDYLVTMAPCTTVCLTPTIGVLAAACSAIVGSFGFSLGAGTGLLGAIFG